ncbi:MAG: hypothetical protein HVN35_10965 [Methanobacteriaceae archaeon]|nr:hypothetical protein [Methanobacteriaceae archaeon]
MDDVIAEYIYQMELGEVQEYKGMSVFPIFNKGDEIPYITLKEALEADLLTVTEIDDSGSVPELKVINKADVPVLLLDGEELVGAKQNRVLNTTILLKEQRETVIPVSCTEQGRWSYNSKYFRDSGNVASLRLRKSKSRSVLASVRDSGQFRSDQMELWNEIDNMSRDARVRSSTKAMSDVYQSREDELSKYHQSFPLVDGQKGLLVMFNGEVMGMDMVSSSKAFQILYPKLLKSYALEAILKGNGEEYYNGLDKSKSFLDEVRLCMDEKHKSVGYGCDHRLEGPSVVGSALIFRNQVIHTAFFNTSDIEKNQMSTYSKRRSYRM